MKPIILAALAAAVTWSGARAQQASERPRVEQGVGRVLVPVTPAPSHLLQDLREAWVAAVDEEAWIGVGTARLDALAERGAASPALLLAYRGAFDLLRSKHRLVPRAKLRHARAGLDALDRAVAAAPDHAEVRYVRLMSCYYLPFFFGRGDSVDEDFRALATLLPAVRGEYPAAWYEAAVHFVLEHGRLAPERASALRDALEAGRAADPDGASREAGSGS